MSKRKLSDEDKLQLRRAIKRIKLIDAYLKQPFKGGELPVLKELEQLREFVKNASLETKKDFNFPEGSTDMGVQTRQGYDKAMLDEMIENGTFDADTAQQILKARYSKDSPVLHIR